ncbi:MAG: Cof-type HAD-IIB family hydrolase [Synergistaceae bacterium]|jgi:Cof subfamily protein (haloacid dehalogenase superfamily)|nr:Cof-type HAD-IIB family hydrolase [Synergistaceae bacterium]
MTEEERKAAGKGIRLVVCDMDGTLLDSGKKISEPAMEAIRLGRRQGIATTICSGRLYLMLAAYVKRLELDIPFISGNGAAVVDPLKNEVLHCRPLPVEDAESLFAFCAAWKLDYCALGPQGGFFSREGKCIERFINYNKIAFEAGVEETPLQFFDDGHKNALEIPIHKVLIYRSNEEEKARIRKFLSGKKELAATSSDPLLVDIMASGVDKGYGLRQLARLMNIPKEEICVFGDYLNDTPMFAEAGLAVAMGNACEEAKAMADFVTESNDCDGVAVAFRKYILR